MFKDWFKKKPPASDQVSLPLLHRNPSLAEVDPELVSTLKGVLDTKLAGWTASHVEIFRKLAADDQRKYAKVGIDPTGIAKTDLANLITALNKWPAETRASVYKESTPDNGSESAFTVFFKTSTEASNYDAIILDYVIRYSTETFDRCLSFVSESAPTLSAKQIQELQTLWDLHRWSLQASWVSLYKERLHTLFYTLNAHGDTDATSKALVEAIRAFSSCRASNNIRIFRQTFLPFFYDLSSKVEASNMYHAMKSSDNWEVLEKNVLKDLSFDDKNEKHLQLVGSYLGFWAQINTIRDQSSKEIVEKGKPEFGEYLTLVDDSGDLFEKLAFGVVEEEFSSLSAEVLSFTRNQLLATA